ncbi:MAG: thiol reductant ABC exporter subunit CydD [Burkholderiaceae bacterium]
MASMTRLDALQAVHARRLNLGALLVAGASLLWIGQAALIAALLTAFVTADGAAASAGARVTASAAASVGASAAASAATSTTAHSLTPPLVIVLLLSLAALRAGLEWRGGGIAFAAASAGVRDARAQLTQHVATRSPRDAGRTLAGTIATLGADKLDSLLPFLVRFATTRWRALLMPTAVLLTIAYISWLAGLVLLLVGPLMPVFMALIGVAARDAGKRQMAEIGQASGIFLDRLRGLVDIRVLDAQARVADEFATHAEGLRARTMSVLRIAFLSSAVLELLAAVGVAMMAIYVGFSLLGMFSFGTWGGPLTVFQGLLMLMLVPEFFAPLREFAAAWHDRASAAAVGTEFDDETLGDTARLLGAGRTAVPLEGAPGIELIAVRAHPDATPLTLTIAPGERVALMGPSGSGKTTLLFAIAGMIAPAGGGIRVAGASLDDGTADAWRERIAWVGQSPHFIAGSIRANVALAGDPRERASIERALSRASAADFVARAADGLDTRLGETGQGVSGGEGRRLAIARAMHAARQVVLADEPTADLDADTAAAVVDGLLSLADDGATLIVATHDEALAARLDRIVRLDVIGVADRTRAETEASES